MKNSLIRCLFLSEMMMLVSLFTYSQPNKVPPFQIIQANGKAFMARNLPFEKAIVIIYFSPECDDCQKLTKELLNRIKELNKASIAMITNLSLDKVKQFVTEYNLDKYPNIIIGTEGNSFFVGNYYKVGKLPFMVLYNKNGDLIKIYDTVLSIEDLIINLRKL